MKNQGEFTITTDLTVSGTAQINDYLLPAADGSAGQVITTDGAGVLSFGPGGGDTNAGDVKLLAEVFAL